MTDPDYDAWIRTHEEEHGAVERGDCLAAWEASRAHLLSDLSEAMEAMAHRAVDSAGTNRKTKQYTAWMARHDAFGTVAHHLRKIISPTEGEKE